MVDCKDKMINFKINDIELSVPKGTTILKAAKKINLDIPTLCYLEGINDIGACRVCVVEIEGMDRCATSCNTEVVEGMNIYTNTQKVRKARRMNVELILSQHNCNCAYCIRSGNCQLQKVANDLGITDIKYDIEIPKKKKRADFPLVRDETKCIKCMRCIQVCDKIQDMHVWDVSGTGARTTIDAAFGRNLNETDCTLCGQCITHCPVGALHEKDEVEKAYDMIAEKGKITVVQMAPAVRVGWSDGLTGMEREFATAKRLVSALKKMGFDYIFDTTFSADLTIMEEGTEFIERFTNKDKYAMPMFTSCCPGWLRMVRGKYPELTDNLSTAKSPQQMFGAVTKSYFAKKLGVDPKDIYCISLMPCLAKKHEASIPNLNDACGDPDVDLVLTVREVDRMIRAEHIDVTKLEEVEFDKPLGVGTGAGVIFGSTGGVMEAALRSAYYLITGENPPVEAFKEIRGMDGWKEAKFHINDLTVRVAIVSGLGNTQKLIKALKDKQVYYDFIEVMACPGGCAGGGGQPFKEGEELAALRNDELYGLDAVSELRFSHENPEIAALYEDFLGKPCGEKSHHLLHTNHHEWKMPIY